MSASGPSTSGLGWEEFSREVVDFFASIKLAMFLFIVLAMTATIGTVIQQGERPETYVQEYGEEAYRWFLRLGFTDVYHTWWFTSLLGLLCVNSLTCFHKRFPSVWRSMRQDKVSVSLAFIQGMKQQATLSINQPKETVAESLVRIFAEKGYKVLAKSDPGEVTVYATKGIMGRVGAHVAHLSATVIVLGGLLGSYYGFSEFGVCLEGQTYHIPRGNFDLHVDKFWIDYHENGSVKSYNSTLTVIDQGTPTMTKTITVNDPLVYKGIWFYQSSYGDAWDQIEAARINVKDKTSDKVVATVDLEWNKEKAVEGLPLKMKMTDFVADFAFNSTEKKKILKWVRPDGKSQVTVEYKDGKPFRIDTIVVSTQHSPDVTNRQIERDLMEHVIKPSMPKGLYDATSVKHHINPTGRFVVGGPMGDTGLTGRKIIVDTYGGHGSHGGGAFSGKDPSKVDRSASYMARYIAKNIVAAGLASKCEVQLAYAIGVADPVSVLVDTKDTEKVAPESLDKLVRKHFALTPRGIIEHLKLRRPIFKKTAAYGHFGRNEPEFTWEKTDKAKVLRKDAGL